jgi:hypothetical protein
VSKVFADKLFDLFLGKVGHFDVLKTLEAIVDGGDATGNEDLGVLVAAGEFVEGGDGASALTAFFTDLVETIEKDESFPPGIFEKVFDVRSSVGKAKVFKLADDERKNIYPAFSLFPTALIGIYPLAESNKDGYLVNLTGSGLEDKGAKKSGLANPGPT